MKYSQALPFGILYGISFGLLLGLIGAFYLKVLTISIPFKDKKAFLSKLNINLAELDYHPEFHGENLLTYKPSFKSGFLAGKITVQIEKNSVRIVGPSMYVKKLNKEIR
jgi:hypothetical protein